MGNVFLQLDLGKEFGKLYSALYTCYVPPSQNLNPLLWVAGGGLLNEK